jgi:hypothetical protein
MHAHIMRPLCVVLALAVSFCVGCVSPPQEFIVTNNSPSRVVCELALPSKSYAVNLGPRQFRFWLKPQETWKLSARGEADETSLNVMALSIPVIRVRAASKHSKFTLFDVYGYGQFTSLTITGDPQTGFLLVVTDQSGNSEEISASGDESFWD